MAHRCSPVSRSNSAARFTCAINAICSEQITCCEPLVGWDGLKTGAAGGGGGGGGVEGGDWRPRLGDPVYQD